MERKPLSFILTSLDTLLLLKRLDEVDIDQLSLAVSFDLQFVPVGITETIDIQKRLALKFLSNYRLILAGNCSTDCCSIDCLVTDATKSTCPSFDVDFFVAINVNGKW